MRATPGSWTRSSTSAQVVHGEGFPLAEEGTPLRRPDLPTMAQDSRNSPLVLVVSPGEWAGRSFESVLITHDYDVARMTSGRAALEWVRSASVDAIIIEEQLTDMAATDLCRLLRSDAAFERATPIIVTGSSPSSPRDRVAIYAAGAWDYCSQPLDAEVLLLKLSTFVRARRHLSELPTHSLIDPATDMYNLRGMRRWSSALSARAIRGREPLACLALRADSVGYDDVDDAMITNCAERAAEFIKKHGRASDIVGHLGDGTFVILAPVTDALGAARMIERLQRVAARSSSLAGVIGEALSFRFGYWAVSDLGSASQDGSDPVGRATAALAHVPQGPRASGVVNFDEILN